MLLKIFSAVSSSSFSLKITCSSSKLNLSRIFWSSSKQFYWQSRKFSTIVFCVHSQRFFTSITELQRKSHSSTMHETIYFVCTDSSSHSLKQFPLKITSSFCPNAQPWYFRNYSEHSSLDMHCQMREEQDWRARLSKQVLASWFVQMLRQLASRREAAMVISHIQIYIFEYNQSYKFIVIRMRKWKKLLITTFILFPHCLASPSRNDGQSDKKQKNTSSLDTSLIILIVSLSLLFGCACFICVVSFFKKLFSNQRRATSGSWSNKVSNSILNFDIIFPSIRFTLFKQAIDHNFQHNCVIFLEDFVAQKEISDTMVDELVKYTVCGHLFHEKCLANWLKREQKCPLCREEYSVETLLMWEKKLKVQLGEQIPEIQDPHGIEETNFSIENNPTIIFEEFKQGGGDQTSCNKISGREASILKIYSKIKNYHLKQGSDLSVPQQTRREGSMKVEEVEPKNQFNSPIQVIFDEQVDDTIPTINLVKVSDKSTDLQLSKLHLVKLQELSLEEEMPQMESITLRRNKANNTRVEGGRLRGRQRENRKRENHAWASSAEMRPVRRPVNVNCYEIS